MVLAWEANLTKEQRKTISTLYRIPPNFKPDQLQSKMLELVAKSKAANTVKSYSSVINKWKSFCDLEGCQCSPAENHSLARFIAKLAVDKEPLSTFLKLSPALVFHHEANGHVSRAAVTEPYIKLLLTGAKREASERKGGVKKADTLSQKAVHQVFDKVIWKYGPGVIGQAPNLADWRTAVRLYTYYKTFCRWDCYSQLLTKDITFSEDHVQIHFAKAKNDQFYAGTYCLLSYLPDSQYCPGLIYRSYFTVMKFTQIDTEFLNCRVLTSKKTRAKPEEKLSYTSSLETSKKLLQSLGFQGKFSEKSFKSSGVSIAIENNVNLIDVQLHGRWRSQETPLIYMNLSKKRRLAVSEAVI
jgi:hypothetical protein